MVQSASQKNQTTQVTSRKETMPHLYGTTVLLIDRQSSRVSSGQYSTILSLTIWWQRTRMVTGEFSPVYHQLTLEEWALKEELLW